MTWAKETNKLLRSYVSCGIKQLLVLLLLMGFVYLCCSWWSQICFSARFISIWVKEKYDGVIGIEVFPLLLNNKYNVNPPKLNNGKAFWMSMRPYTTMTLYIWFDPTNSVVSMVAFLVASHHSNNRLNIMGIL